MTHRRLLLLALTLLLTATILGPGVAEANSITSPDTMGDVGLYTSVALDAAGNPVVSYQSYTDNDLKILHCNDANCAGGGESITSPDTAGNVGEDTSLALDADGYPVVSYHDATNDDLKIMHCNDPNCFGGGESITSPDTAGNVGEDTSLALDAEGYPVVSYYDADNDDLKVMHCNDPNCAGGGESITSPDTAGNVGRYTSLALDADGYPVISYYDSTNNDLKIMHCNDPNCAGGDESMTSPDTAGTVGWNTSLALDGNGYPVVGYYGFTNRDLKVMHCNDPNCAGGDESITSPDTVGNVGGVTSLVLDGAGNPVVSYQDIANGDLKVLHCDDANCAGDERFFSIDREGDVGRFNALALDGDGYPVVSYYDYANGDLKILHCDNADCATVNGSIVTVDAEGGVGETTSLALDGNGYPVVSYRDFINSDLKILRCNDPNCEGGGESITSPDTVGSVGWHGSLALDGDGYPVVSYQEQAPTSFLKILHCNDPNCEGGGESITSPDTTGDVGYNTSLALDAAGNPVVSYHDNTNRKLKVMHCNDPNCAGGDESMTSPDPGDAVGTYSSLVLDAAGYPVISYYDLASGDLKVMHCNDANCQGGDESITSPDTDGDVGWNTSLALDVDGNPVVSYRDLTNDDLKVLHCNDPNCAGDDESVTSPDTAGNVGRYTSLALGADGNPVISYLDNTNGDLKVMRCNDPNCAGGDESIHSPDRAGSVGGFTSLALDGDGYPVVSYYDYTGSALRILHCFNTDCSLAEEGEQVYLPAVLRP